jgi:bifunctional N-acetylglucosamine-1-phosphate-uridyltransferase/glucosamine-1-phosphate-acetyltransferase GlmU-like protein
MWKKRTPARKSAIKEVNTGLYLRQGFLFEGLGRFDRNNAQGEFY